MENSVHNPLNLLQNQWHEARQQRDSNASTCSLATVDEEGFPSVRTLVLRGVDQSGINIFINDSSPKWQQLQSGCWEVHIFWPTLMQQFKLRGKAVAINSKDMAEHWAKKPIDAKLLDHFYHRHQAQSSEIASRQELESAIAELQQQYPEAQSIPYPDNARGLHLQLDSIEHWQSSPVDRLHHRHHYQLQDGSWQRHIMVP
ncbi:MAG: pyridoxamine 5'-phosphate oxidase [Paraglaciecola psychrophila]|jgi:pyridoxamine 5'-phosphate oxidase